MGNTSSDANNVSSAGEIAGTKYNETSVAMINSQCEKKQASEQHWAEMQCISNQTEDARPLNEETPVGEESIAVEVSSNLDAPNGFKILTSLLAIILAIPPYCISLEGGKGVDAVSGIMMKLITCFLITLVLLISSTLFLISLSSRLTFTNSWKVPAFGDKYSSIKTYQLFLTSLVVSVLSWMVVFVCQDWGYTEEEHGGLNALGLATIGGGIVIILLPLAVLPTFKLRAGMLLVYALVIGIFMAISIPIARREYPKGVNGRLQNFDQQANCKARNPLPWLGLAPFRLNFVFSGTECDGEGEESFAVRVSRLGIIEVEAGPKSNGGCDLRFHQVGFWNDPNTPTKGYGYKEQKDYGTRFRSGEEVLLRGALQPSVPKDFRMLSNSTFFTVICDGEEQHFSLPPPAASNKPFDHLPVDGMGRAHAWRKMPLTMQALARIERAGESGEGPAHVYNFMKHSTTDFATGKNSGSMFRGRLSRNESNVNCPTFWNSTTGTVLWSWGMCGKIDVNSGAEQTKEHDEGKEDWFQDPHQARENHTMHGSGPVDNRPPPDQFVMHTDPWCHPDYWIPGEGKALGFLGGPYSATIRCIGPRKAHVHHFDVFDPEAPPALTLIWDLSPHEPTGEVVASVDADLARFIEHTVNLNTTAVVWTADHGNHVGLYPQLTEGGHVEQSNVVSVLTLPRWYVADDQHEGLRANEQRLITHLDLYQTLKDIFDRPLSGAAPPPNSGNSCNPIARSLFQDVGDSETLDELDVKNSCMCEECKIGGGMKV
eukprot:CAMPEP_0118651562 /NCGR_PEP_ID=MMETSP0785-20121206/10852_1 /TAXON_ID=91992 /ORGANISM="Bolidomonas pacifica, Strain CCMP 1866" /LENGTH=769 /DNA_ID=CAMNT_0006544023 /DNA_START=116 /DNA_END=2425 /DNA_ORIENTATION=-